MLPPKCLLTLLLLVSATSVAAQTLTTKPPKGFVTVCEVLAHRGSYDGKIVTLIGQWSPTDEGFWLAADCEHATKTADYVWSNIIFLAYDPSSAPILAKGPKLDLVAAKKKIARLKARSKPTKGKLEWAVVYGRIETKDELATIVMPDGKSVMPAGYGHLNAAPAQIVYRENDLVIIPRHGR